MGISNYLYKKRERIDRKIEMFEERKARLEEALRVKTEDINTPAYMVKHPIEYVKKQHEVKPLKDQIKSISNTIISLTKKSDSLQYRTEQVLEWQRRLSPHKKLLTAILIVVIDLLVVLIFVSVFSNKAKAVPFAAPLRNSEIRVEYAAEGSCDPVGPGVLHFEIPNSD